MHWGEGGGRGLGQRRHRILPEEEEYQFQPLSRKTVNNPTYHPPPWLPPKFWINNNAYNDRSLTDYWCTACYRDVSTELRYQYLLYM